MSSNLLVLSPKDPFIAPDPAALTEKLRDAGFISEKVSSSGRYKPGDDFFHFITFLGCSPVVALGEAGTTAEICLIEVGEALQDPVFVAGANLKDPRCPKCGHKTTEGRAIGEAWQSDPRHRWTCPKCSYQGGAPDLQWRQCAGFGRFFLKVWGVFEGEAVPGDALMDLLERECPFRYFYVRI